MSTGFFKVSHGCFFSVLRLFEGIATVFKKVSRVFQESLKVVSRNFQGCFEAVLRAF